jgi:hypothetical protein
MSNNLGRTEVGTSQQQKELTINNSDGLFDAAITEQLTLTWSGSQSLKTLTTAQLQKNGTFVMAGSTTAPAPTLKMASVQRGMVLVENDLGVSLIVTDYTSATEVIISPGQLGAVYVTASGVKRIFEADSVILPADTSVTVRVATTGPITISTALNNADVIDGVTLATGNRVLVKDQASGAENGIYVVGVSPSRATDFDDGGTEVYAGVLVTVDEGTANQDTLWLLSTNNPITVGSTSLSFKLLSQASTAFATNTEVLTGTVTAKAVDPAKLGSLWLKGANIASAATITIGDGRYFHVTGTTSISDIDWTIATDGREVVLVFDGALSLTHNATTLILPTGADITTAAGDVAVFIQDSGDNARCVAYHRANGTALVETGGLTAATTTEVEQGTDAAKFVTPDALAAIWEKGTNVASAANISLGEGGYFHITGTTTITDIDWTTGKNGRIAVLVFDGILTLTHNATTMVLPGGVDILTAVGDVATFAQDSSDNVKCISYLKADGTSVINSSFAAASTTTTLTGTSAAVAVTPDSLAALWEKGTNIASAATVSVGEGGYFHITGTTTITDIDWATPKDGRPAVFIFDGILTLTHNATTLILPSGANIVTAAGDRAMFIQDSSDNVNCVWYQRADGTALVASGTFTAASTTEVLTGTNTTKGVTPDALAALWEKGTDVASAGTISLGEGGFFHITGTTTITDIDFATAKDGRWAWVVFDGALTLTHNATTLILPSSANITTVAKDRALFIQDSGDNVYCAVYQRADGTALVGGGSFTAASTTEVLTGTDTSKGVTPDSLAALWEKGSNVASAATVSLGEGGLFHITGTTTITDIDFATAKDGRSAWLIFDGALTLTHNATTLILPGGANITTVANDMAFVTQDNADNVYVRYFRGDGTAVVSGAAPIRTITFIIDGGGATITTGVKGDLEIPFACTISRATLLADVSGSIVVDIWKDTYANYPPTNADSITASAKPTITSATKSQDSTLTGWTTTINAGDTLRFNVDSVTTIGRVTLSLKVS